MAAAKLAKDDAVTDAARLKVLKAWQKEAGVPGTIVDLRGGGGAQAGGGDLEVSVKGQVSGTEYVLRHHNEQNDGGSGDMKEFRWVHPSGSDVKLTLVKAAGLKSADVNGSSDPYVKFVDSTGKEVAKSPVVKKSLDPEWNFETSFKAVGDVTLQVWDKDTFTKDDPLGNATLKVGDLSAEAAEKTLDLDTQGTVTLSVAATSDGGSRPTSLPQTRLMCLNGIKEHESPFAKRHVDECYLFTVEGSTLHVVMGKMKDNGSFSKEDDEECAYEGAVTSLDIVDK